MSSSSEIDFIKPMLMKEVMAFVAETDASSVEDPYRDYPTGFTPVASSPMELTLEPKVYRSTDEDHQYQRYVRTKGTF